MALEDLVSQQQEPVTPAGDQYAVVDEGADTPQNEVSGEVGEAVAPELNAAGEEEHEPEWFQKRLGKEVGKRKELEEMLSAQAAELEALKSQIDQGQPKTLNDLDSKALRTFISQNKDSDDPEMAQYVEEAGVILQEKIVEERLAAEREKLTAAQRAEKAKELESGLVSLIAGDHAKDPSSSLFATAEDKYAALRRELGNDVIDNNPLAAAFSFMLAKMELGVDTSSPSLKSRVMDRNNRINTASRASAAQEDNLEAFMKQHSGPLTRSSVTKRGTANEAIRRLNMFKKPK